MTVRDLSDKELHRNLLTLKSKESQIVARIVSHLEEVYRRRLFAQFKCSSIYDYCIRILEYSNGEAHKKISACKLASHCKGVKESIARGELSLSNAASIQVFLNQSAKLQRNEITTIQKKKNLSRDVNDEIFDNGKPSINLISQRATLDPRYIIERVKNKSTRECEHELEKIAKEFQIGLPEKKPSKRNYGDKTLLKIYLDREKLQLVKSRLKINCKQELLQRLLDEKLHTTEPRTETKTKNSKQKRLKSRSISPSKRALVLKRAQKKCENCDSRYNLQIDHILSVARGGNNDIENLRVLCRPCNQRAAVNQLGLVKMDKYINRNFSGKNAKPRSKQTFSALSEGRVALSNSNWF